MSRRSIRSSKRKKTRSSKSERSSVPPTTSTVRAPASFIPTIATIDLTALAHNVSKVREAIPRGCEILAVVKAHAYGHGMLEITRALGRLGIARFAIASVQEGIALREAGVAVPILVMGAMFPEQLQDAVRFRLTPVIHDKETAQYLAKVLEPTDPPYPVHVKVDTGMGRLGLLPEEALELLQSPLFKGPLRPEGLMTHLADADGEDPTYTHTQLQRFAEVTNRLAIIGLSMPLIHAANSAAILNHRAACFTAVRPGIMLYGYGSTASGNMIDLKPILRLTTHIAQVRTMAAATPISYNRTYMTASRARIAVIPVGYADGYSRALSNRGAVLIRGRRASIVGRVCMDMTMVDITNIPDAQAGDPVVLIGRQGTQELSAEDLAAWQGTIPYEVLCGIGPRVPRVYTNSDDRANTNR
jgi:alanine racemase